MEGIFSEYAMSRKWLACIVYVNINVKFIYKANLKQKNDFEFWMILSFQLRKVI